MIMKTTLFLFFLLFALTNVNSQVTAQFRGPQRNGIYPETGLLPQWPVDGPRLLWRADSIGNGYSSPVVSGNRVYVTGEIDSIGYLFAFDQQGKLLWKKKTGAEWMENFTGSRSTPTVAGNLLYLETSMGAVICLDAGTGEVKWQKDMIGELKGVNVRFGYSEGLLVENDVVYCFPGGTENHAVALNRYNGSVLWTSPAMKDSTAYTSPALFTLPARKIIVNFSIHNLIALDAANGKLLWNKPLKGEGDIQASTPLYENGFLYYITGSGNGAVKLALADDGSSYTEVWNNEKVTDVHGGFVKLGNQIYTSQYRPRRYCSIDAGTGQISDSLKFDKGALIAADNMLFLYTEKGSVGLVKLNEGKMELVSSFKMPVGTKEFFTIPVISQGVMYLRHGDTLLAYNIRKE